MTRIFISFRFLGLSVCMLVILACATVPITDRKAIHLVSDSELATLSLQQYGDVLKKSKISPDAQKTAMVRRVGERIARATEQFLTGKGMAEEIKNYKWEFNLIEDDKTANAWCMPGGKVAVYTGILPFTGDENGLAVVMGHEIAHAVAKHGNERMSQALLQQMGGAALSAALSSQPAATGALFQLAYGAGTQVGILLPYSRVHESEADKIGLILMALAGYDPRAAPLFWERMAKSEKSRTPEILSTHPAPETRIKQLQSYIPEAMGYYKK